MAHANMTTIHTHPRVTRESAVKKLSRVLAICGKIFEDCRSFGRNGLVHQTSRRCGRIMTSSMSDRTFTLDEAQSLLPVLESLLRAAIAGKELIEDVEAEMQAVSHRIFLNGGTSVDIVPLARRKAERVKAEQRVRDALAEIDSIGVQVKDIDIGLLDFPCTVEGRTVLLCWKLGEKSITQWHGVEEGFAGRKPIDERIAKGKRTN